MYVWVLYSKHLFVGSHYRSSMRTESDIEGTESIPGVSILWRKMLVISVDHGYLMSPVLDNMIKAEKHKSS